MASQAIVAGVGLGADLIMGLLAKHDARVTAAKEENAATNQAVLAMDKDIKTIVNAANAGDIDEVTAMVLLNDVNLWYWQFVTPFQMGSKHGNTCIPQFPDNTNCFADTANPCAGKDCTAACCLGCNSIGPSLSRVYAIFKNHGGTATICKVYPSKYGGVDRESYTVTYTPPPKVIQVEATINKVSGLIAVGVPPSQNDVVVAQGALINPSTGQLVPQNALSSLFASTNSKFLIFGAAIVLGLGLAFAGHRHAE